MTAEWTLTVDMCGRPTTTNMVHRWHHRAVSADRKQWRHAGAVLARQASIPAMDCCHIEVTGRYPGGTLPDTDAVAPSLKGVIDGLVDAGVIPDDTGRHIATITYHAPVKAPGLPPALLVTVREADA